MRVLVVDDSLVVRRRLVKLLADLPGVDNAEGAGDSGQAVKAVRIRRPDVVVLDVKMHGGNSLDVLKTVKTLNPAPRVIVLTNTPEIQYRKKYMTAGADCFYDKSAQFEDVVEEIKRLAVARRN